MIPSISQICTLRSSFEADLADFKGAGFDAVECWITKLETYLARNSLESVVQQLAEHQLSMPVASLHGGLLSAADRERDPAWELLRRRLSVLQRVGCRTLVVVGDLPHPPSPTLVNAVPASLAAAAAMAEDGGLRLALEFHSHSSFISNLQTAVAVVDQVGSSALGICLDTFHFQVGASKLQDLELLNASNLFHVQVADVADRPRELAGDADRVLPADGEIVWEPIIRRLRTISYEGLISLELVDPRLAQIPARQFAEVGKLALERILR